MKRDEACSLTTDVKTTPLALFRQVDETLNLSGFIPSIPAFNLSNIQNRQVTHNDFRDSAAAGADSLSRARKFRANRFSRVRATGLSA